MIRHSKVSASKLTIIYSWNWTIYLYLVPIYLCTTVLVIYIVCSRHLKYFFKNGELKQMHFFRLAIKSENCERTFFSLLIASADSCSFFFLSIYLSISLPFFDLQVIHLIYQVPTSADFNTYPIRIFFL